MKDIRREISRKEGNLDKPEEGNLDKPEVLCILPPSWEVLETRLSKRGTEKSEVLRQRMEENREQIKAMMKEKDLHFVTNFQYQLTVFGIELFLAKTFEKFRRNYWRGMH